MIWIYRGCAIPAHPNLWEHNSGPIVAICLSTMISVMSCLLLCRPPVRKISKSIEFSIRFCKIKLFRAFSTNSNSMFSYVFPAPGSSNIQPCPSNVLHFRLSCQCHRFLCRHADFFRLLGEQDPSFGRMSQKINITSNLKKVNCYVQSIYK